MLLCERVSIAKLYYEIYTRTYSSMKDYLQILINQNSANISQNNAFLDVSAVDAFI